MRIIIRTASKKPGFSRCAKIGCWCGATDYKAEARTLTGRQLAEYGRTRGKALLNLLVDNARHLGIDKKAVKRIGDDMLGLQDEALVSMLKPFLELRGITVEQAE